MTQRTSIRHAAGSLALVCHHRHVRCTHRHAEAQTPEQFYRGKQIKLLVSAAPGGGADLYARILVNHLGRHIPGNPTFLTLHQPGAGGLVAAGALMNTAPKDGTTIGFLQRNNLLEPVMAEKEIGFDPKRVAWVGSLNRDTYVVIAWHTAGAKTIQDAMARELVLGNTGGGNENLTFPLMLNQIAGTKFKLVRGYKGSDEVAVAIERGEVQGRAMSWASFKGEHTPWINEKKVNILVQIAQAAASRSARRSAGDGLREDRRRPPARRSAAVDARCGPAIRRAARRAGRPDRGHSRRVRGPDQGQGLRRRGEVARRLGRVHERGRGHAGPCRAAAKTPKDLLDRARAIVKAK